MSRISTGDVISGSKLWCEEFKLLPWSSILSIKKNGATVDDLTVEKEKESVASVVSWARFQIETVGCRKQPDMFKPIDILSCKKKGK